MKDTNFISDNPNKMEILAKEVTDLKNVLLGLAQQLRRIERRIDYALPEGSKTKSRKSPGGKGTQVTNFQTLDQAKIEQLVARFKDQLIADEDIHAELQNMTVKHELKPIARYFGMTNAALPPKSELVLNIITRLRQSVMVGENIRNMSRVTDGKQQYKVRNDAHD